ncbi:MAG: sulfite exporter TauE/SafE family protein [Methylococcaceae bacterium]
MQKKPSTHNFYGVLKKYITIIFALSGIIVLLNLDNWFTNHIDIPTLGRDMNYGLLVLIGFLSSFHCVGMCGPLILGYCAKNARNTHKSHYAHLLYGIGKTVSYTSIGALLGAFGSIIAFTPPIQGAVGIAAGIFLLFFGLHLLEVFPALNHFQIKTPVFLMRFISKEYRKHSNPFIIGLLNGLMIICGPLQAMYILAAGTGNWLQGATTLFFFGIGTLPLLMGFGFLSSLLSTNLTPKLLKASGLIVFILGLIMLNRGLAVTGTGIDVHAIIARVSQQLSPSIIPNNDKLQIINMQVLNTGYYPNHFTLRKGIPVQWRIEAKELSECNKVIIVPIYQMRIELLSGIQTISFTPKETGTISWSCWMGMITGTFVIVDAEPIIQENNLHYWLEKLNSNWHDFYEHVWH